MSTPFVKQYSVLTGVYDRTTYDYALETAVTGFFLGFLTKSVAEGDIKRVKYRLLLASDLTKPVQIAKSPVFH